MKNSAFTLIELSIVLVIVGLLISGIVVGRDMIRNAETRRIISDIEKVQSSVNTFRVKYNCLPGDCPKAVGFGLGTSGGVGDNGNGNGVIYYDDSWNIYESANMWYHLARANLIPGNFRGDIDQSNFYANQDFPALASNKKAGFWVEPASAAIGTGAGWTTDEHILWITGDGFGGFDFPSGALNIFTQYNTDTKLDDGLPLSGKIVVSTSTDISMGPFTYTNDPTSFFPGNPYGAGGANSAVCASSTGYPATQPTYNLAYTGEAGTARCILAFTKPF